MPVYHYECKNCVAKWQDTERIHICPYCMQTEVELMKTLPDEKPPDEAMEALK